jgi:hypothetical protein
VRCGPAPLAAGPFGLGIAATDTDVGLATLAYEDIGGGTTLSFARLTASLDLVSLTPVEDTSQPADPNDPTTIYAAAVAPLASGWVVAACGDPQVFIHLMDGMGREVARTVVDRASGPYDVCITGSIVLVPRPGGGPLLLWRSGSDLFASLVADDGRSAGPAVKIVGPAAFYSDVPSAVWDGDAFYVAVVLQKDDGTYHGVLHLVRVPPGGAPSGADILVDDQAYGPLSVTSDAGDLIFLYGGVRPGAQPDVAAPTILWRRLGHSGEPLSNPVAVGTYPDDYGQTGAVGVGGDTVFFINNNYQGARLALGRLATDGRTVTPLYDLVRSPSYYVGIIEMARRGPDLVVGWLASGGSIGLARVAP